MSKQADGTYFIRFLDDDVEIDSVHPDNIKPIEQKKSARFRWLSNANQLKGKTFFDRGSSPIVDGEKFFEKGEFVVKLNVWRGHGFTSAGECSPIKKG